MLGLDLSGLCDIRRYVSDFEQIEKIGKGGFSTVYRARNRLDGQLYAVKKIRLKPSEHRNDLQEHFEKILREGKLLCQIEHPNILRYHAIWFEVGGKVQRKDSHSRKAEVEEFQMIIESEDSQDSSGISFVQQKKEPKTPKKEKNIKLERNKSDKKDLSSQSISGVDYRWLHDYNDVTIYIQLQLCQESLYEYVDRRKNSHSNEQNLENYRIILQLIDGIECMHNRKIIHRDIKLQNVLLNMKGVCKICDFGLAKRTKGSKSCFILNDFISKSQEITEDDIDKFSSSVGTKIFSSPQQSTSSSYDHRTDIYSLGLIIGILFSTWSTKHEEFEMINKLRSKNISDMKIHPQIISLLERCLSQPQFRPSLKQIRKCFTDLLFPAIQVMLKLPGEQDPSQRSILIKNGILYVGQASRYSKMYKLKGLKLLRKDALYLARSDQILLELTEGDATELLARCLPS